MSELGLVVLYYIGQIGGLRAGVTWSHDVPCPEVVDGVRWEGGVQVDEIPPLLPLRSTTPLCRPGRRSTIKSRNRFLLTATRFVRRTWLYVVVGGGTGCGLVYWRPTPPDLHLHSVTHDH